MAEHNQAFEKQQTVNRDSQVQVIILLEGLANFVVLVAKLVVGVSTGSLAIISDALHSLTDVANNLIAWFVVKQSSKPADREHPYGHRKFETLAVMGLAFLLAVLAVQIVINAFSGEHKLPGNEPWERIVMLAVLAINLLLAIWQNWWARRLGSDILHADARHTFADVLTTLVVIAGWQLSVMGYPWLDKVCALGVAALIFYLAYGLFRRAAPSLLDEFAIDPRKIRALVEGVDGVKGADRIRSRKLGQQTAVDMVIYLSPELTNQASHQICDEIETRLKAKFGVSDASIHVEPFSDPS